MTPQLQMAIRLLQLNRLELAEQITQALMENPVLEEAQEAPTREEREANVQPEADPGKELTGSGEEGVSDFDWESFVENYNVDDFRPAGPAIDDETREYLQNSITRPETLAEHLLWQVRLGDFDEDERRIAAFIIGNLNGDGYLEATTEELCEAAECNEDQYEAVRAKIRLLDPIGVGSRTLHEYLLSQLEQLELAGELPWVLLTEYEDLLQAQKYKQIARKVKQPLDEVIKAIRYLASLSRSPAADFPDSDTEYVVPDVYVQKVGDEWVILLNEDGLPKLKLSSFYRKALSGDVELNGARDYIKEKMESAKWLIKSIHQRQRTIYRVMETILKYQRNFFDYGVEYLKPMTLDHVAEDVRARAWEEYREKINTLTNQGIEIDEEEMEKRWPGLKFHASTVSRVVSNKYVHTPRGIFPLKYFFNSGISTTSGTELASESVKEKIKQLVGNEPDKKPYTDIQLVELLKKQGIDISRRTVTKYRESLGIPSSSKRKRSIFK